MADDKTKQKAVEAAADIYGNFFLGYIQVHIIFLKLCFLLESSTVSSVSRWLGCWATSNCRIL